jgi:nicotinic acid phosphoribosyltransferase
VAKIKSVYDQDKTLVGAIYKPGADQFMMVFDYLEENETNRGIAGQISEIMKDMQQTLTDETIKFLQSKGYRPKDDAKYVKGLRYRLKKKNLKLESSVDPQVKVNGQEITMTLDFRLQIKPITILGGSLGKIYVDEATIDEETLDDILMKEYLAAIPEETYDEE